MKKIRNLIIMPIVILSLAIGNKVYAKIDDNFYTKSKEWISSNQFYTNDISIKRGMITTLQFSSIINYFVIGDELISDVEQINSYTLLLSAKISDRKTNLNVATKDGNYVFMVNTLDYDNSREPNLHINIGELANNALVQLEKVTKKQEEKEKQNPNYDYKFNMYANTPFEFITKWKCKIWGCRYEKVAPKRVWTDGQYTYLDYNTNDGTIRDIPNIMEVLDDIDTPMNFVTKGQINEGYIVNNNIIVVHKLARKLTLIANGTYLCIEYVGDKYDVK